MSDANKYYEEYYKKGGEYSCETHGHCTSRTKQIIAWLNKATKPGDKILDIGCGDMFFSTLLPDRDWLGLDINIEKTKGKAVKFDAMVTPYPVESGFEAIISSEFLEHVWDMRVVHKEAYRLLKPNGHYIISTPNLNWMDNFLTQSQLIAFDHTRPWTMEHIRHYTPQVHFRYLEEAGFKVKDWTGLDAHYGQFFAYARAAIKMALTVQDKVSRYEDDAQVDCLLGRAFPEWSHTIGFLTKKEV